MGKPRGFDGPPPKEPAKIRAREEKLAMLSAVANKIRAEVELRLIGTDLYCLRKTHISWARQLANADSVKLQVGHAPQDIEERHYLDLVDAHASSEAVWDVLMGARTLERLRHERPAAPLAIGAESRQVAYNSDYGEERLKNGT